MYFEIHSAFHAGSVEGELDERAVPYWTKAGQWALARVALPEALGRLTNALSVNGRLPGSAERDRQELHIRVTLAISHRYAAGHSTTRSPCGKPQPHGAQRPHPQPLACAFAPS